MNNSHTGSPFKSRIPGITRFLPIRARIITIVVFTIAYVIAYAALYPLVGPRLVALSLLPIGLTGLFFGGGIGIVGAFIGIGLNYLLFWMTGQPGFEEVLLPQFSPDALLLIIVGITLGWLSDLRIHTLREQGERQRTEWVMRAGEEKLSSILAEMNEVVYSVSVPGLKIVNINPAAERLYGRSLSEIIHNPRLISEAVYPDDRPMVENSLSEVLSQKEGEWIYRIFRPNGEVRWILDRRKLITQKNNLPVRIDYLVSDITARKLAEDELLKTKQELELRVLERTAELQAANKQLQVQLTERIRAEENAQKQSAEAEQGKRSLDAVMEFIPEGIAIADAADLSVRLISRHGLVTLQKSRDGVIGIPMLDDPEIWPLYHHPDGITPALLEETPLYRAIQEGEVILNEEWLLKQDHGLIFILCNAGPIRNELGEITGGVIAWRDITDRKKVQEEVQEKTDTIEVQHYLLQGREMERQRTARTLHDNLLQNLITISYAFNETTRIAREKNLKDTLNAIRTTLQDQIDNLRAFCGEVRPPILVHFGVEKGIRSHVEKFQENYPDLKVHLNLSKDGLLLPEDIRLTIFRIYMELINNVAKHAHATSVYVRFGIQQDCAELEVADNGMGFEVPESWVEMVRSGHLGLIGIRERVEALNGSINVRSSSAGTIVNISFPIKDRLN